VTYSNFIKLLIVGLICCQPSYGQTTQPTTTRGESASETQRRWQAEERAANEKRANDAHRRAEERHWKQMEQKNKQK